MKRKFQATRPKRKLVSAKQIRREMKIPTEEEIIKEVKELKSDMKKHDFQMGIGGKVEKRFFNRINKILRMLKKPIRRVDVKF